MSTMFPLALQELEATVLQDAFAPTSEGGFPHPCCWHSHISVSSREIFPSPTLPLLLTCCRPIWISFSQAWKWNIQLLGVSDVSPSSSPHLRALVESPPLESRLTPAACRKGEGASLPQLSYTRLVLSGSAEDEDTIS